jgi:osmotically-inducible protein OsmY
MKKLTPFLLSAVLMVGAAACSDGGSKTAGGPNSDTTKTDTASSNTGASSSPSTAASPSDTTAASPSSSTAASPSGTQASPQANANNNDAAVPDKAAQKDATSDVRRAQANSDIRAREQRNNAANGGTADNRADNDIQSEVRSKLEVNIPSSKLEVKAKDGAVTVTGAVPTQNDLSKIDTLAKQIKGVKSVTNQAKVVPAKNQ